MIRQVLLGLIIGFLILVIVEADFDLDSNLLNDTDVDTREVTTLLKRHRKRFRLRDREDFRKRLGHYRRHKGNLEKWQKKHRRAKFRLNKFSLMSEEEQKQHFGVILPTDLKPKTKRDAFDTTWSNAIPDSFDFRAHGKVTPIKNQGPCGSCWAFSTAGAIESQYLLQLNQSLDLSEQYLVNCNSGAWGCNGGNVAQTLTYVQKNGIPPESCLPYTVQDGTCTAQCDTQKYSIGGYNHFGYDESKFPSMLYNYGPAVVTMYVPPEFMLYDSGILEISKEECIAKNEGLHAMLIVGYTPEYWIIKNSWDTDWGEDGYVRVKRGIDFCWMTLEVAAPFLNVTMSTPVTVTTKATTTVSTTTTTVPTRPPTAPTRAPVTNPPPQTVPTRPQTVPTQPQPVPTRPQPTTTRRPYPFTTPYHNDNRLFQGCSQGTTPESMTNAKRTFTVKTFNQKRSEVAHGQLQLPNGKRFPPGSNIRKLKYDCYLENLVQQYANTCVKPSVVDAHMVLLAFPYNISYKDALNQMTKSLFTLSNDFNITHQPGGLQVFAKNGQFLFDEATHIACAYSHQPCFSPANKAVITCGITPFRPGDGPLYTIGCSACRHDDFCTRSKYRRCDLALGLCYEY